MGAKLNQLLADWPAGTVVSARWLEQRGISPQLVQKYRAGGWLQSVGHGAFSRMHEPVDWPGAVFALQRHLHSPIHVGARSALELKGLAHNLPLGKSTVWLIAPRAVSLPSWFRRREWSSTVRLVHSDLLPSMNADNASFSEHNFGGFTITVSAPERAAVEVCDFTPRRESFESAVQLIEGLGTLRPAIVQRVLEQCRSIKAKRLFLALAERHAHDWLSAIDSKRIDLGTGKRSLYPGGRLNKKYQLVLPPELVVSDDEAENAS